MYVYSTRCTIKYSKTHNHNRPSSTPPRSKTSRLTDKHRQIDWDRNNENKDYSTQLSISASRLPCHRIDQSSEITTDHSFTRIDRSIHLPAVTWLIRPYELSDLSVLHCHCRCRANAARIRCISIADCFLVDPFKRHAELLSPKRQSARMSEIKNVGQTWMALNTSKCNHLTPLRFKGLTTYCLVTTTTKHLHGARSVRARCSFTNKMHRELYRRSNCVSVRDAGALCY